MLERYYDLDRNPFSKAPDPGHLFVSAQVEEAIARLEYAALEREIGVLTGDIGVGKTTVTRAVVDRIDDGSTLVWVMNPRLTPNQLLQMIARRLEIAEPSRNRVILLDQITERVFAAWEAARPVVVLIDEAQMLPFPDTMEELRLLTNVQMDNVNLMAVLMVGQPELKRRLAHPRLAPLAQRIGVRYHLGPMSPEDVEAYVTSRLASAGRQSRLFDDEAMALIAQASGGVARVVNNIAANALLAGAVKEEATVTAATVADVCGELGLELEHGLS